MKLNSVALDLRDGPVNVTFHCAVTVRERFFVFGGLEHADTPTPQYSNKLWEYSFETRKWCLVETTGTAPAPRAHAAMVRVGDALYVFGGTAFDRATDERVNFNDLFRLDTTTMEWEAVKQKGDVPVARCAMAMAACNGLVYMMGGCQPDKHIYNDLFVLTVETHTWKLLSSREVRDVVTPRCGHHIVATESRVYVLGGWTHTGSKGKLLNDVLIYDVRAREWVLPRNIMVSGRKPSPRAFAACAVYHNLIVVLGGTSEQLDCLPKWRTPSRRNVYCLNMDTLKWKRVGKIPANLGFTAAAHPTLPQMYLVGGPGFRVLKPSVTLTPELAAMAVRTGGSNKPSTIASAAAVYGLPSEFTKPLMQVIALETKDGNSTALAALLASSQAEARPATLTRAASSLAATGASSSSSSTETAGTSAAASSSSAAKPANAAPTGASSTAPATAAAAAAADANQRADDADAAPASSHLVRSKTLPSLAPHGGRRRSNGPVLPSHAGSVGAGSVPHSEDVFDDDDDDDDDSEAATRPRRRIMLRIKPRDAPAGETNTATNAAAAAAAAPLVEDPLDALFSLPPVVATAAATAVAAAAAGGSDSHSSSSAPQSQCASPSGRRMSSASASSLPASSTAARPTGLVFGVDDPWAVDLSARRAESARNVMAVLDDIFASPKHAVAAVDSGAAVDTAAAADCAAGAAATTTGGGARLRASLSADNNSPALAMASALVDGGSSAVPSTPATTVASVSSLVVRAPRTASLTPSPTPLGTGVDAADDEWAKFDGFSPLHNHNNNKSHTMLQGAATALGALKSTPTPLPLSTVGVVQPDAPPALSWDPFM